MPMPALTTIAAGVRAVAGLLALLTLASGEALARPEQVVLIRHGHKDRPVGEQTSNYNLSAIGQRQALQLAGLPACLGVRPEALRLASYGFDLETGKNARSYQTLVPMAVASGRNIRVLADAEQASEAIGQRLLQDPTYEGTTLVIAWEHRRLPQLARGLGWSTMPDVDDGDFDSLWLLRFRVDDSSPQVRVESQRRLLAACSRGAAPAPPGQRP
ncbi:MAG: hypothetical protein RLZZ336_745 [Cyanobacteriota bacterium]